MIDDVEVENRHTISELVADLGDELTLFLSCLDQTARAIFQLEDINGYVKADDEEPGSGFFLRHGSIWDQSDRTDESVVFSVSYAVFVLVYGIEPIGK